MGDQFEGRAELRGRRSRLGGGGGGHRNFLNSEDAPLESAVRAPLISRNVTTSTITRHVRQHGNRAGRVPEFFRVEVFEMMCQFAILRTVRRVTRVM